MRPHQISGAAVFSDKKGEFMRQNEQLIRIEENGLKILFRINQAGIVELIQFSAAGMPDLPEDLSEDPLGITCRPALEVQLTGQSTRGMHAGKHNLSSASLDFRYKKHMLEKTDRGTKLTIFMETEYGMQAEYHMQMYDGISVVQTWSVLTNHGAETQGLEYVSSFMYHGLGADSEGLYSGKMFVYTPCSGWNCEARWKKETATQVGLTSMLNDGFRNPGFGTNRYAYGGLSSWSSCEYLPMGICEDSVSHEVYIFQLEHSGQWYAEYGSHPGNRMYLALSGATESEHGWWKELKPGESFTSIPAAFGVATGDVSRAVGELTKYRRAIRRDNKDDRNCYVVFNDYMNCLEGDPTEEKEYEIIDQAAKLGCEYYCLDAGWYDSGYWWDRVGEWMESAERFPGGLKAVCDYARSKGMQMGLWLEIEVMGIACRLAKELPDDWFVCRHGKRYIDNKRYLLDFRNPEVRSYCRGVIDRLIQEYGVNFFKIDYNVTMGYGSDLNSDSPAEAIREHYMALYGWYEDIFRSYPDLVIENCGSGGQRMDYGMLKLLSLQSASDQTDYIYNSYIAANVASGVTPEQCGMWVYPYEDEEEHIIYNMVNGLLLRPYISGMVWKLTEQNKHYLKDGIALYKEIREDVRTGTPVFPLGFCTPDSSHMAYGVLCEEALYLSVFFPGDTEAEIPVDFGKEISSVKVLYPSDQRCEYCMEERKLKIRVPMQKTARFFKLTF